MTATITGNQKHVTRVVTGFYSLDHAFVNDLGELGVPVGVGYEIFGTNGIGKSTLTFCLGGLLGKSLGKNIVIAALEDYDGDLLQRLSNRIGFDGNIHILDGKSDEDILDGVVAYLFKKEYAIGVVDSLGAISPISEREGDLGEANMGRRAMLVAQLTRKCMPLLRPDNSIKTVILLNHYYPKIGTRGWDTPAGEVKKYMVSVRVKLQRIEEFPDGSYVLKGTIVKNRWGLENKEFHAFMVVGVGLHRGLSAMYDCLIMKKATRGAGVIKIGDQSLGRLSSFVVAAKHGNEEVFAPFYTVLEGAQTDEPDMEAEKVVEDA